MDKQELYREANPRYMAAAYVRDGDGLSDGDAITESGLWSTPGDALIALGQAVDRLGPDVFDPALRDGGRLEVQVTREY